MEDCQSYKTDSFSHFELLADEKSRLSKNIKTNEEKKYKKNQEVVGLLADLNDAYEKKQVHKIFKSIKSLISLLDFQIYDNNPQLIPEQNIIQFFEIFINFQEQFIREPSLLLFSILIKTNDISNNNVGIMIKNSFLDIIFSFKDEIANITNQCEKDNQTSRIILYYLEVINSLILFCNQNINSENSEFVIQLITFDFIFSLFELTINEKGTKSEQIKFLTIVQNYFAYFEFSQKNISSDIFSKFLHLSKSLLSQGFEDSYFFSEILNTLTSIINSNTIDQINWNEFVDIGYPNALYKFSMKRKFHDYRLIQAASDCITACTLHGFANFRFNIDDVFKSAIKYPNLKMYHSLFKAYVLLAAKNDLLIDPFFQENSNYFLQEVSEYSFDLKKEAAMFFASMIQYVQPKHVNFLIETKTILVYLYHIYAESADIEILSALLMSFSIMGPILISLYSLEQLNFIFSDIIPPDFSNIDTTEFDDYADFQNFQLIRNDFSFLLEVEIDEEN